MLIHNSMLNNMIEQVYSHAKYKIILFRYVLDKYRKNRIYIENIRYFRFFSIFSIFFEKIMIFFHPCEWAVNPQSATISKRSAV